MRRSPKRLVIGAGLVLLSLASIAVWTGINTSRRTTPADDSTRSPNILSALLAMSEESLNQMDVGRMNLLCAEGLPGNQDLDVEKSLAALDAMAARARIETERHFYRFQTRPADYEHSQGFFRMLILAVVLAEDFGVKYAPGKIGTVAEARTGDGFFGDPQDIFLPGLITARRQGTCSSLPVLHVAVGRRLGYPLKLVTTRGHLFIRWESAEERFNVEVSSSAVNRFEDDYYRRWPMAVTEEEVRVEGYLKSLNPAEELAAFLSIRAMCWLEAGRPEQAAASFRAATRLAPRCRSYREMLNKLEPAVRGEERAK